MCNISGSDGYENYDYNVAVYFGTEKYTFLRDSLLLCSNLTMAEPSSSETLTPAWHRTRPYAPEHCIIKVFHIFTFLKDEF